MGKGRATRENILASAFEQASRFGLESLTIGELAKQCGLSKSGLFAHFRSRENLQLAVLEYAATVFRERVIAPVRMAQPAGSAQKLHALLEAWLAWNESFSGRCMFLDAWSAPHEGEVQQAARDFVHQWLAYLQRQIVLGQQQGDWDSALDPWQAVYRLYSLYLGAQVFDALALPAPFWPEVERLMASWHP
ncbi:TetR/AcrR family transcriptional regulator [Aeromonas simiae]|uniref:TetR/AcrR family transcriptional regulator n=1 Tax=Aeromonas simiae TaxID=218936 RepID=UPI0005A7D9EE|nr:helix-turn-helix domain-containing protein [Aeromonas simiae]MDO2949409.1 TetR/AcrR family transcriptional regulator [Aeromonas simiae]MDO2952890.1 TetR/AcrR family transcriptional regulator [Aeromonas simiae]MDO2956585.1 TetR/AcrR family transcriptional regulator [Aeromonas simiae]